MSKRRRFRRRFRRRSGAAAVEFALVAPLLFFGILFPIVEIGRAMMVTEVLIGAAQRGCRTGVLPGSDNNAVIAAVKQTTGEKWPKMKVRIEVNGKVANTKTAVQGDSIAVTVMVPYSDVGWLPTRSIQFLKGKTLSSTEVMRRE